MSMKKKGLCVSLIIILVLFVFWGLSIGIPRHMENSYSSVKEFQLKSTTKFYDFYAPQSYFNQKIKKQTLTDINNIDIWYQESTDNYYSIVFKGASFGQEILHKNIEVTYSVTKFTEDEFEKIKSKYELIDDDFNIYSYFDERNIFAVHNYNNQEIVEIFMTNTNNQLKDDLPLNELKSIINEIMKDSINLNERNN